MQPPMIGSWTIRVEGAKPFTIHGDEYFELHAVRTNDPEGQAFSLRVPRHALSAEPFAGQVLLVKFLMGQVTEAKPVNRAG
ncbi:MAG TPA: hypothetical protein VK797_11900 [Tepidisphaeraceae bacterium]|jgi:hypothetical protein|nr:hypothetical protein [Tepidisphaeraceae bacterium]